MFTDKIKSLLIVKNNGDKDSKKKIESIVVFIIILIITIIAINNIWNKPEEEKTTINTNKQLAEVENTVTASSTPSIEENLEMILSEIEGVGKVKVLITYSESSQIVAMYNENNKNSLIEEKDSEGGIRTTTQTDTSKDVIFKEEEGNKVPMTQKIINPKIEGAIITAEGGGDSMVKNNIIQAVEAVTGLATHKIQVFEMKKEE